MFIIVMGWIFTILIILWILSAFVSMVVSSDDGLEHEWQAYLLFFVIGPLGLYFAIQLRKEDRAWKETQ